MRETKRDKPIRFSYKGPARMEKKDSDIPAIEVTADIECRTSREVTTYQTDQGSTSCPGMFAALAITGSVIAHVPVPSEFLLPTPVSPLATFVLIFPFEGKDLRALCKVRLLDDRCKILIKPHLP